MQQSLLGGILDNYFRNYGKATKTAAIAAQQLVLAGKNFVKEKKDPAALKTLMLGLETVAEAIQVIINIEISG